MNWGKGITIAMVLFIGYIMTMVVIMISTSSDLVEDNYYEQGVNFEDKIQAIKNSQSIKDKLIINVDEQFLSIEFPSDVIMDSVIEGKIHLYRPDNGSLDKHFAFSKKGGNTQLIPIEKIEKGNYKLLLSWKTSEKDYYIEKKGITI